MKYAYVVAELSCTVTVCCYDPSSGELMKTDQVISTLSDNFDNSDGSNTCAHIMIHPTGKFLYVSDRGGKDNSIALFHVVEDGKKLKYISQSGAEGLGELVPRAFNITLDGAWMVVAYQNSDKIVSYKINQEDGTLKKSHSLSTPTPVCMSDKFLIYLPSMLYLRHSVPVGVRTIVEDLRPVRTHRYRQQTRPLHVLQGQGRTCKAHRFP